MSLYVHAFLLAIVQGIFEFLPISSTAHLQLLQMAGLSMPDPILFDGVVHGATLVAVILFYRRTIYSLAKGVLARPLDLHNPETAEVYQLVLATIPAVIFGFLFQARIESFLMTPLVIAVDSIVFGLLLWWVDKRVVHGSKVSWTFRLALIVGLAQALSLFPGVSRSGITMSAALLLGFSRVESARFAILMSIPVTLGAVVLTFLKHPLAVSDFGPYALGFVVALGAAMVCLTLFMRFLDRFGYQPYAIYRILLGVVLIGVHFLG